MKLDQIDKNKSFTRRLLHDFSGGLFALLQERPLESITIAQLCTRTNYPRSTFYNYFEDIYALMDYCWEAVGEQIRITEFQSIDHTERTLVLFNMVYDYMEENRAAIDRLLRYNPADGAMMRSLERYINRMIHQMVTECPFSYKYPVPYDVIARHYSNTVEMILSACFQDRSLTKEQALSYIDFLLGTLEKESTRK